ncbi:MAG TPA: hypothetical protein VLA66_04175 [Thermoanaerobaculia bacterium]|nr:hypothetical protein [Thermoanaerobaculia bacterium]
MRAIAYLLIGVGFVAAAYQAVRTVEGMEIPLYLAGLAVGVAGVALARWHAWTTSRKAEHVQAGLAELHERLERLHDRAQAFEREKDSIRVGDLKRRVEDEFVDDLAAFAERRETIAVRFGLQAYADVMSPFASAERHLNRVWSASTDGYGDEAREMIGRAREELADALESLRRLAPR